MKFLIACFWDSIQLKLYIVLLKLVSIWLKISFYICEDSFGDRIAALYHNHYFTVYQKVASQCTSDINWLLLLSTSIYFPCFAIAYFSTYLNFLHVCFCFSFLFQGLFFLKKKNKIQQAVSYALLHLCLDMMGFDIYTKKSHGSHLGAMYFLGITPVLQGLGPSNNHHFNHQFKP